MNEKCYTCEHKGKCYRQATFYEYEDCDHYSKSINTDVEGCLSIIVYALVIAIAFSAILIFI